MADEKARSRRRLKYDDADLAYMRSLSAAVTERSPRKLILVLALMAFAIASGIVWMDFAKVDVVVRGSGKVIPSLQLQIVQSLEGGVVEEILVHEGDLVELGQPVIKISDIAFSSSFEENHLLYLELRAKIARLEAEAHDTPFKRDEEVAVEAPNLLNSSRSLFESRRDQLQETRRILEEQVRQQKSELTEARAKRRQLARGLSLMREELTLKQPLVKRGLVSQVELLQLQQREIEFEGDLEAVELSVPRIESTIEEGKRKVKQSELDFRNKAKEELNESRAEASRISETQLALKDRVQRTTLRSPVKGTVKRLNINTVGGVISAGAAILEIVPFEDTLLVEVRIKPADIANIRVELPTRLKFSAYDFAIYGSIVGKVVFLSADTVTNEEGESYYVARIRPARDYLGHEARPLPVRVGMTVEADIITDKKTVLDYLLKPINRGLERALTER